MRADQILVERGLATSRSQAQRLIASGVRWSDGVRWKAVVKNGDEVPASAQVELLDDAEARYVSRGGLKLEGALKSFGVSVEGVNCLDVGQSTGGFTDCLLKHGARQVVGVDVGRDQVHESLREDARVACVESLNAREIDEEKLLAAYAELGHSFGESGEHEDGEEEGDFVTRFDFVTGDLSFISLTLVLPAVAKLLEPKATLVFLVKPQFELQPGQVGKGGIVKDESLYAFVEARIRTACAEADLDVKGWIDSPISGGDGNREFFIHAVNAWNAEEQT